MSIHRLLAIARKKFRHIAHDVRTLFLVTFVPAFLLVTLSYVFAFDVDGELLWNQRVGRIISTWTTCAYGVLSSGGWMGDW